MSHNEPVERVEVEAYSLEVNAWIVRTGGRRFPALVVQGDSFHQLYALAQSVLERARACRCDDAELTDEAEELRDLLWGRLQHYEETLRAHGFDLPYDRAAWPR